MTNVAKATGRYPVSAYDKYVCLKMSLGMWLTILYLLRPYLVTVMSLANRKDKMGAINMVYHDPADLALSAFAALPTLLLLVAYVKKSPEASAWVKKIWGKGRMLLMLSASLNFAISIKGIVQTYHHPSLATVIQLLASIMILIYLFRTPRVADTFSEFPS